MLLLFSVNSAGATTTPTGWTSLWSVLNSNHRSDCFYRFADGTEGSSVTISCTGLPRRWAHTVYRITGADTGTNPEAGAAVSAATANPDPPSLNPAGWGTEDTLWFAAYTWGGTATHSSYPTGYSVSQLTDRDSNTVGIATAGQNINAASADPGTGTISASSRTVANTVSVRPAAAAGVTGTGDVTFTVSAIAASGTETITGTAAESITVAGLSATGTETISGTASETISAAAIDGTGTETLSGTGTITLPVAAIDASGTETITGTGSEDISVAGIDAAGTAGSATTGTGDAAITAPVIDASGSVTNPAAQPPHTTNIFGGFGGAGPLVGNMRAAKPTKPRRKKKLPKKRTPHAIIEAMRYQQALEEDALIMMTMEELV